MILNPQQEAQKFVPCDPAKTTPVHPLIDQKVKDSEQDRELKKKWVRLL